MTLDFARSLPVEPGTNLKGEQAAGGWLFLLPSLDLGRVALLGDAPAGTAAALSALAGTVSPLDAHDGAAAELVYVGRRAVGPLARDAACLARLRSTLHAGSSIYLEAGARPRDLTSVAASLGVRREVVLAPRAAGSGGDSVGGAAGWRVPTARSPALVAGRAEAALRLARAALARRLGSRVARGGDRVSEPDAAIGVRRVNEAPPRPARGEALLLRGGEAGALPAYVREVAAAAGTPLLPGGWRIAPPRGYRSQKVIFFVRCGDGAPAVVKLTQDPRFNALLDNEARALAALARVGSDRLPRVPRLLFAGTHAGLSVVGEQALAGRAYVQVAHGGADCATAATVAAALTGLGAATRARASGVDDALGEIVARYVALFGASSEVASRLRAAVAALAALGPDLPLVFMHGDATVFNVLVADDGTAGFVDWENADASGMPLWDLMHFLATHHVWSEERAGRRARPADVALALSDGRRLDPLRATALSRYVEEIGVPVQAVAPLRLTWAARHALREARQLPPTALPRSFHHRLLGHLIEQP